METFHPFASKAAAASSSKSLGTAMSSRCRCSKSTNTQVIGSETYYYCSWNSVLDERILSPQNHRNPVFKENLARLSQDIVENLWR